MIYVYKYSNNHDDYKPKIIFGTQRGVQKLVEGSLLEALIK